jgi:ribosomal protein S18 acetylase RimI-like enzyme
MTGLTIAEWTPHPGADADLDQFAALLHAAVHGGASVSFVLPFSEADARMWWSGSVVPGVTRGVRRLVAARLDGRIVGAVQVILEMPPNQRHRAEVAKLLVHPDARRRGIARALMIAVEEIAMREGRTLLTLDTRTGDHAEALYVSMGYVVAGVIPGYARAPGSGELEATTLLYKELEVVRLVL